MSYPTTLCEANFSGMARSSITKFYRIIGDKIANKLFRYDVTSCLWSAATWVSILARIIKIVPRVTSYKVIRSRLATLRHLAWLFGIHIINAVRYYISHLLLVVGDYNHHHHRLSSDFHAKHRLDVFPKLSSSNSFSPMPTHSFFSPRV